MNASLLARLAEDPGRAAILLDVDGTLAPIVPAPEEASVPPETRAELARLGRRYALVACVSGRPAADAERVVGLPELTYVGLHGLELDPGAESHREAIHAFADTVDWPIEDKGVAVSFHYRGVDDEAAARAELERVAERARAAGLRARFGRLVLEILPPVEAHKGTAVRRLLERLELGVRVAVGSDEGPPELREAADLVVDGPAELLRVLRGL